MNLVKKFPFNCTECGNLTNYQNKRIIADGCIRRHFCTKCANTFVVQYDRSGEIVKVLNAYKKVKI